MYKRLIPSILIHEGRLVKGRRYRDYRDAGSPATTARAHNAQSADELIVCDIDAFKNAREPDWDTLQKVAEECFMPLTIFGGISTEECAEKAFEIGADKIGLTTTAYDNPALIETLARKYGTQAVVLGLDIIQNEDGEYKLYDHRTGKTREDKSPLQWAKEAAERGAGEIRIMAVEREGRLKGFDLPLYQMIRDALNIPLILEGGAESLEHIETAYRAGVEAVALGAMLVFSDSNLVKIRQHMRSRTIEMRP